MISRQKVKILSERMAHLGIFESDLEERFIRSSGPGGQNVNKVSSCVWLKHGPTKTEVKCQKTRSQQDNRFLARRLLCDKIEALKTGAQKRSNQILYKIRKQKQKRSKRAKEKMLGDKKKRSSLKSLRQKPYLEYS